LPTILLQEVEARRVSLDDPISKWLPDLRAADRVTLGMLAGSMSGYPDYVHEAAFDEVCSQPPPGTPSASAR
jgi:CubicO group peptidase (beta-lactamase class C family)